MIIMPSLTALAGRAGDWDRAFISAAKLRGELLCWDCAQKQPQTACRTRETSSLLAAMSMGASHQAGRNSLNAG